LSGTQAPSCLSSASIEPRNADSGSGGIASLAAERWNLAAFSHGRNSATEPSTRRYALRPSKIDWP
jgi:hypothetical protein